MSFYDNRRITLDPGLTLLALRGLTRRGGHYPFIEPHTRWRRVQAIRRAIQRLGAALLPALRSLFEPDAVTPGPGRPAFDRAPGKQSIPPPGSRRPSSRAAEPAGRRPGDR
jgi:hypothetical protein